ncbi:MAG: hypothetical protein E7456_01530 [Ruminococcaceae bacterium]|nr:hypothetical protein [Oscillospiraceae bacterium]
MNWFASVLEQYGDDAVICVNGVERNIKAFVNPVIGERYMKKWKTMTKLGESDEATYYFFGPPDCEITDCDNSWLTLNGKCYKFIRAEAYRVEGKISHWEAVLRHREEEFDG